MALQQRAKSLLQLNNAVKQLVASRASVSMQLQASYGTIEDKGRSEENVSFRKEDERLLRQLLNKVKQAADTVDVHGAENSKNIELQALKEILGKYNVSDADLEKVVKWKHASL